MHHRFDNTFHFDQERSVAFTSAAWSFRFGAEVDASDCKTLRSKLQYVSLPLMPGQEKAQVIVRCERGYRGHILLMESLTWMLCVIEGLPSSS